MLKIWTDLSMAYVLLRVDPGGEALVLAQKIWPESVSALELYATRIYCSNLTEQSNYDIVKNCVGRESSGKHHLYLYLYLYHLLSFARSKNSFQEIMTIVVGVATIVAMVGDLTILFGVATNLVDKARFTLTPG